MSIEHTIIKLIIYNSKMREAGNFVLERELYSKLIMIYRSPRVMIIYTIPPDESEDNQIWHCTGCERNAIDKRSFLY